MGGVVDDVEDLAKSAVDTGVRWVSGGTVGTDTIKDAVVPDIPEMPEISTPGTEDVTAAATIDDSGARAAEEERMRRARASGRASTILTSPSGLSGPANIGTATLLG